MVCRAEADKPARAVGGDSHADRGHVFRSEPRRQKLDHLLDLVRCAVDHMDLARQFRRHPKLVAVGREHEAARAGADDDIVDDRT